MSDREKVLTVLNATHGDMMATTSLSAMADAILAALRPSRPAPRETPDWEGFVREMFDAPDRGDWDGGEIQEVAVKHGVLREVTVTEPCSPEGCVCAEVDAFPLTCYRLAPKSAAPRETEPSEAMGFLRECVGQMRARNAALGQTAEMRGYGRALADFEDALASAAALRASNGGAER